MSNNIKDESNILKIRPFLKWPGGKFKIIETIKSNLPPGKRLIEPFVGSGAVFLNTNYNNYILNDINFDVISLYRILQKDGESFIKYAGELFNNKYNNAKKYYQLRKKFNSIDYNVERAAIFIFLIRHGYNGLCRFNNSGEFNVPFGSYAKPYFPEYEMLEFSKKSKKAKFYSEDFQKTLQRAKTGDVIYCDPPYVPLSSTANFTSYSPNKFGLEQQIILAKIAKELSGKGIRVIISNHYTEFTKQLYLSAKIKTFSVQRFISCNYKKRQKAKEILAIF